MSAQARLAAATRHLADAGVPDAARDARVLLAHAMGVPRDRLTLLLADPVDPAIWPAFDALVARRAAREPVSKIIGTRLFYGRPFAVTRDVLDPRPETEILIEAALQTNPRRILDLGTGSGCILLTLLAEIPSATGVGTDISAEACAVARRNAAAHGLEARATFVTTNWTDGLTGPFDMIVANPPYIATDEMAGLSPEVRNWDPHQALTDNADGMTAYYSIINRVTTDLLADGGRLLLEIGPSQGRRVAAALTSAMFDDVAIITDLDRRDRVVTGIWPGWRTSGHR